MVEPVRNPWIRRVGALCLMGAGVIPGCAMVPRDRYDESQRLAQSLRAENARLKDEIVGLQTQNRDYADRSLDDLRRLTARDQAIERLEASVRGYQDDRDRLADAYRRLATGLGRVSDDSAVEPTAMQPPVRRGESGGDRKSERLARGDDADASGARGRPSPADSGP